ncbi:methyltransferase domain-containing protein [Bacillus sp. 3255]|uniref:methyltransferase domain-containing protein n=1 Tax=Bacillus sp. 3255 TaxID=2817904 RepID=UPI00286040E5|nr:methyltransferase domain-containing protein [Bacillus sp. 3255]MDR6881951.1 ubiquinone/menaquinone biosynthesis C-methylase UbiE/glycosyltransferase involved in cell wall biosynthesis [Bacillus sp. 3255]
MFKKMKRVLIGSPVHQKPNILSEFLTSLIRLKHRDVELGFFFIDDNVDGLASEMLQRFSCANKKVTIYRSNQRDNYEQNETTHHWNEKLIWKVADFKNRIIQHAINEEYDYLFLIDSDLLLHIDTLECLIQTEKDIVSEIFWTSWQPDSKLQPQVWLRDEYTLWEQQRGEVLSEAEIVIRSDRFISQLKVPGVYEVGGLGACTLISRRALLSGVNFKPINNVSFWGEDRHFCIRAAALGFSLYVDTHYPAYHIYRESDLDGVEHFFQESGGSLKMRNKLTLSMVVKNESNRFLKEVLQEHRQYIDAAVIIDDGSTDDTVSVCLETLKGIPVRLVRNEHSKFHNEINLRKQQWLETLATEPDWILNLDADEMFEHRFATEIHHLLQQQDADVFCFRLYDFWDEIHYREDVMWQSHFAYRPFLLRYRKDFDYKWKETPLHCGRFPENVFELPHRLSELRVKHLGWSKFKYRLAKYQRYVQLDPEGTYGSREQYESILDVNPNLVAWVEREKKRNLDIIHTLPLWIRGESINDDLTMALACLESLRGSKNQLVVIYNQGCMKNSEWKAILSSLDIPAVILGEGENIGIAHARQICFEYIWKHYPNVDYLSEIHVDMVFPKNWFMPLLDYLDHSDEPMISPGIVTKVGDMQPIGGHIEVPAHLSDLCLLLEGLARDEIYEGFVHPVIHKVKVLHEVGGYDIKFLKGKQGYEDDSLLLSYHYYMGTRMNWKPKCNLQSWVYHATMAQRMSLADKHLDFSLNEEGLFNQYGAYGIKKLAKLHCIQESIEIPLMKRADENMSDIQQKEVWDQLWSGNVSYEWDSLSQIIFEAIVERVEGGVKGKSFIETGSGTGKISLRFAKEGADVTLVDYSEKALNNSREAFRNIDATGSFVQSDVRNMDVSDGDFDITWNAGVLEHFPFNEKVKILKEMARVTKPGGIVLVFVPNAKCLPYRVGKAFSESNGTWMYGAEEPVMTLKKEFDESGITLLEETDIGFMNSLDFLDFIPDAQPMKKWIGDWFEGLSVKEKSLFPGYLLLSVGRVDE